MKKLALFSLLSMVAFGVSAQVVVETSAYSWHGDTVSQGPFTAVAVSPFEIVSDYSAQPGYYMGIDKQWKLKNDISSYPKLTTPNRLHEAVYNMGLDEMINAVEPDTTLRTGKEWAGVWTRDVSYSILLSMAYLQPEASRISLMKKVDSLGRIIQDTGSGGAWPVSTDRQIWTVAAWEVYKVTGDKEWLKYIYPIIKRSLETDREAFYNTPTGLVRGETSFIDWREQSHPRWMQTADIYNSETLSTSVVHAQAWHVLGEIAEILGHKDVAKDAFAESKKIADAINKSLWLDDKGYYAMYLYGRDNMLTNPRAETLGESLAIMWDIASPERARTITASNPTTPYGAPVFFPQIADMPAYHNNSLWPWVASWWGLANAKAGNEEGVMEAIGSVVRPAALFATNKENLNLDNGDIATELNSSNMLWCLSGNLALTHKILFGIDFRKDGLEFRPFVPKAMAGTRTLDGFKYRDASLDITVSGYGDRIKSFIVNGKEQKDAFIPAKKAKGNMKIEIVMADNEIEPVGINRTPNVKAPLTPIAWLEDTTLVWNPIEYIGKYIIVKDGRKIAETHATTFDASEPGEYQVIGVSGDGVEGFASEPRSTRPQILVELPATMNDKTTVLNIPVEVPAEGDYFVSFRYANGNGPVNTENKCAIRTLSVDGEREGLVVLPQRGRDNWDEFGWTNSVKVHLNAGSNTVTLDFRPEDENMNIETNSAVIDALRLVRN
ncbi:MAG: glycogen debranching protein [Bacteroidales bacterium]|nr:glycogen debranching protein [Bacteroidales bacterium]